MPATIEAFVEIYPYILSYRFLELASRGDRPCGQLPGQQLKINRVLFVIIGKMSVPEFAQLADDVCVLKETLT
jgi:hypothetical protein